MEIISLPVDEKKANILVIIVTKVIVSFYMSFPVHETKPYT